MVFFLVRNDVNVFVTIRPREIVNTKVASKFCILVSGEPKRDGSKIVQSI